MLPERVFLLGGWTTIALGVALGAGLWWAGAGLAVVGAWLAAGFSVGLGAFFLRVARDARRHRRGWLGEVAEGRVPPGGPLG